MKVTWMMYLCVWTLLMVLPVVYPADPVCNVPPGRTDPEDITEDSGPKGYVSDAAKCSKAALIQKMFMRCEDRYCCAENCTCDTGDISHLYQQPSSCASSGVTVALRCYVEHHEQGFGQEYFCCAGYQLDENEICVKTIDCSENNGGCGEHTDCINGQCICKPGFERQNRTHCSNINECSEDIDGCQHDCVDEVGTYRCTCDSGYTLSIDRHTCEDIDECDEDTDGCEHECVNDIGTYRCICPSGFTLTSGGKNCQPLKGAHVPASLASSSHTTITFQMGLYIAIPLAVLVLIIILIIVIYVMRKYKKKHKRNQDQQAIAMASTGQVMIANPIQMSALEWQLAQQQQQQQFTGLQPVSLGGLNPMQPRPENVYANSPTKSDPPPYVEGATGVDNSALESEYDEVKTMAMQDFDVESNKLNELKANHNHNTYATHIEKPTTKSINLHHDNLK